MTGPMNATVRTISLGRADPVQRAFRITAGRTLSQDVWLTRVVRLAGLDDVRIPVGAADDVTVFNDFLTALVEKVFAADVVGELLAGVLVPEGSGPWTAANAAETKLYLLGVADEADKRTLLNLVAEMLHAFLSGGRSS